MSLCGLHCLQLNPRPSEASFQTAHPVQQANVLAHAFSPRLTQSTAASTSGRHFMVAAAATAPVEAPLTDKKVRRPDLQGRFGQFGGKYVPETLISALTELEQAYAEAQQDSAFQVWLHAQVSAHSAR